MRKVTKLWTTKDGSRVRICDMGKGHLLNAIAMLERATKKMENDAIISGYDALSVLRGEIAVFTVENELQHLEEYGLDPCDVFPRR